MITATEALLISLYVLFGMLAGGPIWLVLLSATRTSLKHRQQWKVVDSVCKRLGVGK